MLAMDERNLVRVASYFKTTVDDIPYIARCILDTAEECIQVSRVADYFTGIIFNIDFINNPKEDSTVAQDDGMKGLRVCQHLGRKMIVSNKGAMNRMRGIAALLGRR
jgi:hypothetical protein